MRGSSFRGDRRVPRFLALLPAVAAACGGGGGTDVAGEDAAIDIPSDVVPDDARPDIDGAPDSPAEADGAADGTDPPTTTVALTASDEILLNPERGFYRSVDLVRDRGFGWIRDGGYSLAHAYVRLDDYRDRDLDAALLDAIDAGFAEARLAGIKIILRFSYNFGPYPDSEPDASKAWILRHLEQLTPLLRDNADVLAVLQAGFIGAWGEWHTSTNGLLDDPRDKFDILEALLAALPADRMVLLRHPPYKQDGYGGPLTAATAFDGSSASRIGHHNDCFLASDTDFGTYPGGEIDAWKDYVAADTLFVPMQGETCNVNPPRSDCSTALAEMERLHWSIINDDYHPDVVQGWSDQGCRPEMERRLGYRLRATSVTWAPRVPPGGVLPLTFVVRNDGWAAPFQQRPVRVVLDGPDRRSVALELADPRRWLPGEESTIAVRLRLPAGLAAGSCELALWLPDAAPTLRDDPRFAIRLADEGAWRPSSGFNTLASLEIDPGASGDVDPSATELVVLP